MATNESIAQNFQQHQDGPLYNSDINEYEIWLAGEVINYASTQGAAFTAYAEALRVNREHGERNPANRSILWQIGSETRVLEIA